ncbi:MAG: HD domain-containing protein [Lachnospiraceae bacterium]|nr:HD domain-containing protein [Lachnospiraceae bacterium]
MRLVKIDQLTGSEILARSIVTPDYKEILAEGTLLKVAYIPRLEELGIKEVFVRDNELDAQTKLIIREEVGKRCKEKVKDIISKHMYNKSQDMTEIAEAADKIITNVINDDNVTQQIYDIRERSADLYEHCISTCTISTLVAIKMKITDDLIHDMGIGCLLHDLGLRYVTVDYIDTDMMEAGIREKEEYLKHPIYGYSAIQHEEWLSKTSKEIILMHHETIDGEGYPLHNPDIMKTTRIVSACDFFDESICGIGHERKRVHEAVEYLKAYKGIKYDAEVVDTLLDFIAVYPSGVKVIINTGEMAVVIRQNKGFPERPVLQLIADRQGRIVEGILVRDLLEYTNIFIDKVID